MTAKLTLTSRWTPAAAGEPARYDLTLYNAGSMPLMGFRLAFSGPAAVIDARAGIEGATLVSQLSNYSVLAPLAGFALAPGTNWHIRVHTFHPLRHWTDGARGAYVVLADGQVIDVDTQPVETDGSAAPRTSTIRLPMQDAPPVNVSIIPWPNAVAVEGRRTSPSGLDIGQGSEAARQAACAFTGLVAELFPDDRLLRPASEGGLLVSFRDAGALGPEAYELIFDASGATIAASAPTGFLYGLNTLAQILRGARQYPDQLVVPATGSIVDAPALGWRGTHLDAARHFYPVAEVKRLLHVLAWNKLNRFHWHLSDDEAWRVQIDACPELTAVAAWRGHGLAIPPLLGSPAARTGGVYSKAEIREIVALGQSLGVEIVPEIDMPGHCYAVLQSLPAVRDPDETGEYQSVQGFPNDALNPAREPVYRFVETIIDELLDLFPAGVFHLGADEVPLAAWSGSPEALALLEQLAGRDAADVHRARAGVITDGTEADAIAGSGTATLQAHFIARIHRHIAQHGAITGGWEEAAHGDVLDKARSYLVGWRSVEVNRALADVGYDIVAAPAQHYYLDMAMSTDWAEPGAGWAGTSSPEETYRFEPRAGWSEIQIKHLLGVQCCIWSEPMADPAVFDRLVFPRLSAVAETGWTRPEHKSWVRFATIASLMPNLYGNWSDE